MASHLWSTCNQTLVHREVREGVRSLEAVVSLRGVARAIGHEGRASQRVTWSSAQTIGLQVATGIVWCCCLTHNANAQCYSPMLLLLHNVIAG